MRYTSIILGFIAFISIALLFSLSAYSQNSHCPSFKVTHRDSLVANDSNQVLYNTVIVSNPSSKTVIVEGIIVVPGGWKQLASTTTVSSFELKPGKEKRLPINLLKTRSAVADWTKVKVILWQKYVRDTHDHSFYIKSAPNYSYKGHGMNKEIMMADTSRETEFQVYLKNTGNVTDTYELQWENQLLSLHTKDKIILKPGRDTVFIKRLIVDKYAYKNIHREEVSLLVRSAGSPRTFQHVYIVNRRRHASKMHTSAYNAVSLRLESGVMNVGEEYAYYYGVRGGYRFSKTKSLDYFYRSRQIGSNILGIQRDLFRVDYRHDKWTFSVGQISSINYFFTNGNGLSIIRKGSETEFSVTANIHNPAFYYKNDNFTASAGYKIGKIGLSHMAIANYDRTWNLNSYLLVNNVDVVNDKDFNVTLTIGGGIEEKALDIAGVNKYETGYTVGYLFHRSVKNWLFNSQIRYNSDHFSGNEQGLRLHLHSIGRKFGSTVAEIFYSSNSMRRNLFRDSLYNSDILSYNNTRTGIRATYSDMKSNASVSAGVLQQSGIGGLYGMSQLYFLDYNHALFSKAGNSVNFNMQSAYGSEEFDVYVLNASTTINTRYGGLMGVMSVVPDIRQSESTRTLEGYTKSFNGGPFVNFGLLRRSLSGSVSYNFSKTSDDDRVRQGVGFGIRYRSAKLGLQAQLNGYLPVGVPNPNGGYERTRYGQFSLVKDLNIPVLTNRKYYDLKVQLYNDLNGNGKREASEPALVNVPVAVGDEIFITDKKGGIRYRNIDPGHYEINMLGSKSGDLIPSEGPVKTVVVNGHTTVAIPFKSGRIIKGKVTVILDSLSNTIFTADMIKVTASDSANRTYTTLTDNNGEFRFIVPEGKFRVYLNSSSFEGSNFRPDRMSFEVDLVKSSAEELEFVIRQKKREIRFLKN